MRRFHVHHYNFRRFMISQAPKPLTPQQLIELARQERSKAILNG